MKKKAIKYTIFLLILPLIISLVIAIYTDGKGFEDEPSGNYNGVDIPDYDVYSNEYQVKSSDTFIYLSGVTLVVASSGIWFYIKKKGNF